MPNMMKTAIVAAFTNVWLPAIGGGVAVVSGTHTTQGIPDSSSEVTQGQSFGAAVIGKVRVLTDSIGTVEEDGEISVNGKRVYVDKVHPDGAGAVTTIDYRESRRIEAGDVI